MVDQVLDDNDVSLDVSFRIRGQELAQSLYGHTRLRCLIITALYASFSDFNIHSDFKTSAGDDRKSESASDEEVLGRVRRVNQSTDDSRNVHED